MRYNPNIPHLWVGYNPLILTFDPNFQQDIQVVDLASPRVMFHQHTFSQLYGYGLCKGIPIPEKFAGYKLQ